MRRPTRREAGLALLLAVPPGIGVTGLAGFLLGTPLSVPSAAAGALVAGALFALLLAGVAVGDPDRTGFDLPADRNS